MLPGFLRPIPHGLIDIQAAWPAYPAERGGWKVALRSFGIFPPGTEFEPLDDIDCCTLFLALGSERNADKLSEDAMHIAVWDDDMLDLAEQDLLSGVVRASEAAVEEHRRAVRHALLEEGFDPLDRDPFEYAEALTQSGEWVPAELPEMPYLDSSDYRRREFTTYPPRVSLRPGAWTVLDKIWQRSFAMPPDLQPALLVMLREELFDSAVREVGAHLEQRMKDATNSTRSGFKLIEEFIEMVTSRHRFLDAHVKLLRLELRTGFKFIRNEFAHGTPRIERGRAYVLVSRMCELVDATDRVVRVLAENPPSESS